MADIPTGTGLGSSGSFTVGVLKALRAYRHELVSNVELAEQACHIEIDAARRAGGQARPVHRRGRRPHRVRVPRRRTGRDRAARPHARHAPPPRGQPAAVLHRRAAVGVGGAGRAAGRTTGRGRHAAATTSTACARSATTRSGRSRPATSPASASCSPSSGSSSTSGRPARVHDEVDRWISAGIDAGALGGKLVGAGGGGFLLFYAEDKAGLRQADDATSGSKRSASASTTKAPPPSSADVTRTIAILAGGLGTRVAALTGGTMPKAMLPARRPALHRPQARRGSAARRRSRRAAARARRRSDRGACRRRRAWELHLDVVLDGDRQLGTGGALQASGQAARRAGVGHLRRHAPRCRPRRRRSTRPTIGCRAVMTVLHNRDRGSRATRRVADGRVVSYTKGDPPGTHEYIDYGYLYRSNHAVTSSSTTRSTSASSWIASSPPGRSAASRPTCRSTPSARPTSWPRLTRGSAPGTTPGRRRQRRTSWYVLSTRGPPPRRSWVRPDAAASTRALAQRWRSRTAAPVGAPLGLEGST